MYKVYLNVNKVYLNVNLKREIYTGRCKFCMISLITEYSDIVHAFEFINA